MEQCEFAVTVCSTPRRGHTTIDLPDRCELTRHELCRPYSERQRMKPDRRPDNLMRYFTTLNVVPVSKRLNSEYVARAVVSVNSNLE